MVASNFDSFDSSPADAYIQSPGKVRGIVSAGDIYACGSFFSAGSPSVVVRGTAVFDDKNDTWLPLNGGIDGSIRASNWYPSKKFLYLLGGFSGVDSVPNTRGIAKWDGDNWTEADGGVVGDVARAVSYLDEIAVVGNYSSAGGVANTQDISLYIESTDSYLSLWSGTAANSSILECGFFGSSTLVIGGLFTSMQSTSVRRIAQLNGSTWTAVGSPSLGEVGLTGRVNAIYEFKGDLWVGGAFNSVSGTGQAVRKIAKRIPPLGEGGSWVQPGTQINSSQTGLVFFEWKNELYIGGTFRLSDGDPAEGFFRYDEASDTYQQVGVGIVFTAVGTRVDGFTEDKNGNLIICGKFNETGDGSLTGLGNIVGWNGSNFFKLDGGAGVSVVDVEKFPI